MGLSVGSSFTGVQKFTLVGMRYGVKTIPQEDQEPQYLTLKVHGSGISTTTKLIIEKIDRHKALMSGAHLWPDGILLAR